jgi:hypothetical protein
VSRTLSSYRVTEPSDPFYSIVVADDREGAIGSRANRRFHILYRGTTQVVRTSHLPTVGRVLLNELETLQCSERDDATYIDAGVVSTEGKTALVPGPLVSYLGKAARYAERTGLSLSASRPLAVERGSGRVSPVRPELRFPRDSLERLTHIVPADGTPSRPFLEEPVDVNALFTYVALADEPVQSIPRGRALHYFAANVMNFGVMRGEALETLGRVIQTAKCYQLSDAPAPKVIDSLSAALQSLSPN